MSIRGDYFMSYRNKVLKNEIFIVRRYTMKKLFSFSLIVAFILISSTLYAEQKAPLGIGNIAVKFDYINFTDSVLKDADVDSGFYIGIEGYVQIVPNLYLGAEAGYTNPDGNLDEDVYVPYVGIVHAHADTEVTFVPIELNLKYAIEAAPNFVIDIGAGGSYNYVKVEANVTASALGVSAPILSGSNDDWLWGGQFFADLNYTINQFFIGVNGKYQLTEDFKDSYDYNNWRVGGQIGIRF
jgi:hypothetical protein